jgi:hypothetical protein
MQRGRKSAESQSTVVALVPDEREGKAISSLMTKLRLTPQAKYSARAAYTAAQSARSKPWELGG